ncbi:uncharacterized protein LOC108846960 [Raphanus sativus]|uniref:Uncharacterized protein LOC108846960 n=1 Tax=Raphanus sativus TaxID=3726 RepID=A0A6J0MVJ8_RAPSA|nr:uncharacterized protein LOC108846960 [Raphanus sativus]
MPICRLHGLFGNVSVCFASFYDGVSSTIQLLGSGGIPNLEAARDCLVNHGLPLESAIPGQDPLYAVRDMIVHHAQRYPTYQEFEQHLFTLMLGSPVAAAVLSFPSLFEGPDRNGLHYPTPAERLLGLDAYVSHVMLATGRGSMRERGPTRELLEFLEFQDSMPGNGGVIKLRLGPNERTVLRFVELIGPYIRPEDEEDEEVDEHYSDSDMEE